MDLFTLNAIFLIGTAILIPVIYCLSWLFGSILWGTLGGIILLMIVLSRVKFRPIRLDSSSVLLLIFTIVFSSWIMFKTFHAGPGGELFVGSNNVFDFGHSLGIIRSFSWGSNIPMASPFQAGLPFLYHFFFYFWVAILEYFRVPAVWAMNIPSILSFSAMLITIYYLPQVIAKQKPLVGWVTVLFAVTNSSLAFWQMIWAKGLSLGLFKVIWRLPTYPFAGPFDGSVISIFVTLNNYVNQRHLGFSVALGLLIFMYSWKIVQGGKSRLLSAGVGALSGVLFLWNIAVFPVVIILCGILYVLGKQWKLLSIYLLASFGMALFVNAPNLHNFMTAFNFFGVRFTGGAIAATGKPAWNIIGYLWQNLGLLPIIALIGIVTVTKKIRAAILPLVLLFTAECIFAGVGHRGFDQKFYSFLIIGMDMPAAVGTVWLWQKQKIVSIVICLVLTVSGFIDLIPIKNEFAFPLVGKDIIPVISWIHSNTPKNAVFVSYTDMIDPVVFAGRRNYNGFYGNIGWYDRSPDAARIYSGDMAFARAHGISYIIEPKYPVSGFPYVVRLAGMRVVYEDARYRLYAVK